MNIPFTNILIKWCIICKHTSHIFYIWNIPIRYITIEILSNFFDVFIITDARLINEFLSIKAKYDDVKDSIKTTLAKELISTDSTIVVKGLQEMRKKYDVEIKDEKLKTQYANYIQNSLSQLKANDNK